LLERFCPGPITVVCKASSHGVPAQFFNDTIAARNRTIGVRIPSSSVERAVAAATPYPITTVAVRDPTSGDVVTHFETALEIVRSGTVAVGDPTWCAIKGNTFYNQHSTVVEVVEGAMRLRLVREGHISFDEVESYLRGLPPAARRAPTIYARRE
jgi:L-threonylcarbamoyladenylate synthase